MTRSELIDALAAKRALSRRTAEEVVGLVFDSLRDVLEQGGRAEIRGFGSFKVRQYEGYQGRNPRTGAEVTVLPKVLPVFKVSKGLHARLNRARLNRELEET